MASASTGAGSATSADAAPVDAALGTGDWTGRSVLSIRQFDAASLRHLFAVADHFRGIVSDAGGCDLLRHRVLANVFYENSTRTSASFHAAMLRLGGTVLPLNVATSSVKKGETLPDTIRCLEQYADVLVLRHPEKGSSHVAGRAASIPVLNAGDGPGEHPTQALLDMYTIAAERGAAASVSGGGYDGLTVTMLGDLKYGRTVHSLALVLSLFGAKFNFVSPDGLGMPDEVCKEVAARGCAVTATSALEDVVADTDVLYVCRIQKERFETEADHEAAKGAFVVNAEVMAKAKKDMVLLHPLPRVDEIDTEVDDDPRAAYFRQMQNGMFVRMALLAKVLGAPLPDSVYSGDASS